MKATSKDTVAGANWGRADVAHLDSSWRHVLLERKGSMFSGILQTIEAGYQNAQIGRSEEFLQIKQIVSYLASPHNT